MTRRLSVTLLLLPLLVVTACKKPTDNTVHSFLSGQITVRGEADTTDFSGFEVVILSEASDTLASAVTDHEGNFVTPVVSPQRGIYPLRISRYGLLMAESEFLTAEGDSAFFRLAVPLGDRPVVIRSHENSAWSAYRNAKAAYNSSILELAQAQNLTAQSMDLAVRSASEVLWSIQGVYPSTMAAELAASESIIMLEGRSDSLLISRGSIAEPEQLGYLNVVRAVRRAMSRRDGVDSAVNYLKEKLLLVHDDDAEATLTAEIVQTYQDSSMYDDALREAKAMQKKFRNGKLSEFSDGIVYELDVLRPGFDVPEFSIATLAGETVTRRSVGEGAAILEFFDPVSDAFRTDLLERDSLISLAFRKGIQYVAISVNPDPDINEAFFQRDGLGETPAQISDTEELTKLFNVRITPRRILISDSTIIGKYDGRAVGALYTDIAYGSFNN